jgi:hypothetical protein
MNTRTIHRVSGHVILGLTLIAMLLVAVATVLTKLGRFDPAPNGDEGTAAHLFQLAIALLAPAGLTYVVTADWQQPRRAAMRLVVPALALLVAFTTLYYMEHSG